MTLNFKVLNSKKEKRNKTTNSNRDHTPFLYLCICAENFINAERFEKIILILFYFTLLFGLGNIPIFTLNNIINEKKNSIIHLCVFCA